MMTFFAQIRNRFHPVPDDKQILVEPFLKACHAGILPFLDILGATFMIAKADVSANVAKLEKKLKMDPVKFSTFNAMLDDELQTNSTDLARTGGLWLKRGLEFTVGILSEIVECRKTGTEQEKLGALTRQAYEKTLKKHHGWIAQKLTSALTRALPGLTNFLKTLRDESISESQLISDMALFVEEVYVNVVVLNDLFVKLDLDDQSVVP